MSQVTLFFRSFYAKFGGLFKAAAKTTTAKMAESIRDIALVVVNEISLESMSSDEKRQAAFDKIKDTCIAEGKEFTTSSILTAQQLAYNILKDME